METFVKDRKEIKGAESKSTTLRDEILCDRRLMNELHALNVGDEEIDSYLPLLITYLDQRAAEEDPKHELKAPYPGMTMKLIIDDSGNNYIFRDYPDAWADLSGKSVKGERYKKLRTALAKTFASTCVKPWVFV